MGLLDTLSPRIREAAKVLVRYADSMGYRPVVTSARRSASWQRNKWNECQARKKTRNPCPYPVARPGLSRHETGLAFDLVVTPMEALTPLGHLWERIGGRWGGRFGDPIHFDL